MRALLGVAFALACACVAQAGPANFQHIVIIVQENRTPDNLFYLLCETEPCSTNPGPGEYDIQTQSWFDKGAQGGTIQPSPLSLASRYDPFHDHPDFLAMCDFDKTTSNCRMDGAAFVACMGQCPPNTSFSYVTNTGGMLDPYLFLAAQYGWSNYMFQTNQGPSFPAHQFLFGATSAPNARDDRRGTFAAENLVPVNPNGCIAAPGTKIQLINARGKENPDNQIYPCFEHQTLPDLLAMQGVTWRYYTPSAGSLWTAPDAISHICEPVDGACIGELWQKNVALNPLDFFTDIGGCNLSGLSWIIPSGQFSDHPGNHADGGGPSWVARVVNAIGQSKCTNTDGSSYWDSTAIVLTWDDWGGWYDHEPPTFLPYPEGGYQYGFRVPMIFISAYTPLRFISNARRDFGSIIRFVEGNFGIPMGALTFADARTDQDLSEFYKLSTAPRIFEPIPSALPPDVLDRDAAQPEPPDND